jgi:hypothetical protein
MLGMRGLTTELIGCPRNTGMVGDDGKIEFSGEHRRKGMLEFVRLSASFLDSFYQDDL